MLGFVFPGQGSQQVGMGRALARRFEVAARTFQEADEALGFSISSVMFDGPEDSLKETANCQPAILAHSVAICRVLRDLVPDMAAGHSLGEITALVSAGSLSFGDGLRLVRRRGELMQEAVPVGVGGMVAINGAELDTVQSWCTSAAGVVGPSNVNGPEQIVVSGEAAAVERVAELARKQGTLTRALKVSAPFHSLLMSPAAEGLRSVLDEVKWSATRWPVLSNVTGKGHSNDATEVADALVAQVTAPVQWQACVESMRDKGVTTIVEIGSSGLLRKMIGRIAPDLAVVSAGTADEVAEVLGCAERGRWTGTDYAPDLGRYTTAWRSEGWRLDSNRVRRRGDDLARVLPDGQEWRFEDPKAHGF